MPWCGPDVQLEETGCAFPTLGPTIVDWIENYLIHGPGDVIGQPLEVDDEMYEFICRAYRLHPETGARVYRRAFLSRPKGRSKSEVAGTLVCAEALAEVRFAGWDAQGLAVGRPVQSPYIRCLATEEGQSGNTFDNASVMLGHVADKFGDDFPGIDIGRSAQSSTRIILHSRHGEIVPSTASGSAKDGGKETFAVFDETHLYVLPELHRMHDVVRRNLRKRMASEPWSLETSTMYRPGEDSVAEQTHEYAKAIAEGKVREVGLLFDHREAPADVDLEDHDSLLAGLQHVYGPAAAWMDLEGIIAEIWDPQADPSDSRRYWLNQVVASTDAWLNPINWDACLRELDPIADDELIALGFDGSLRQDATALIACRLSDGHLEPLGIWERPLGLRGDAAKEWQVPTDEVNAAVDRAFTRFDVAAFYADPPHWREYVDRWTRDYGEDLQVKVTAKDPIEYWTNQYKRMAADLERFEQAVDAKHLSHPGDSAMSRHMKNARRYVHRSGLLIRKETPQSPKKIDAAMAGTLAYAARCDAVAAGAQTRRAKKRSRKLYRF